MNGYPPESSRKRLLVCLLCYAGLMLGLALALVYGWLQQSQEWLVTAAVLAVAWWIGAALWLVRQFAPGTDDRERQARLHAEHELALSEERFAAAFQANPCAMSIVRLADGVHLEVNEKWLREMQMKRADVIGRTGPELSVWRAAADRDKVYKLLHTEGSITGLELTMHPQHGKELVGLMSAVIITLNGERCVLFIVQDISERKRTEKALQEREERLRLTMQAAGLGAWEYDIAQARGTWMPEYAALFGLKPEQFDGTNEMFLSLLHPDDRHIVNAAFQRGLAGDPNYGAEFRVIMPDGSERWHSSRGRTLYDEQGRATRVIGVGMDITERKRVEAALRDREERLRLSLQAAGMGTWVFDVTQERGEWSPEYEALFGFPPGEYDGTVEWFLQRVHPDDVKGVRDAFRRELKGNPVYQIDFRYYHADGSLRWQSNLGRMMYDADGKATHVIGVGMDVTDRKHAELALQEREARLRLSMQAAGLGTWDLDLVEGRAYWSPEYEALFGFAPGEYDGRRGTFFKMVHPADRELVMRGADRTPEQPQRSEEIRIILPDGRERWHLNIGRMHFDEQGQPTRMIGVGMDITDRKLAEQALQEREERLRLSMQISGMGTWDFDWQQRRVTWSPEYSALFGLAADEFDDSPEMFLRMVHPDDLPMVQKAFLQDFLEKSQQTREFRVLHLDGSIRWHLSIGRMFFDEQGKPAHVIGVGMDITERKHAEQVLQASRTQLRQLTARLQNAREAERAEIARNIHDDLGQSMTGLKFLLKWLETQLTPAQTEARAKVAEMLEMASAAIGQIRRVATSLRPGILDDFGLVAALEWQAQEFAQRTGVACRLNVKPTLHEIETLERDCATAFFRIFQEALTNVTRHARATRVDAQLFREDDVLVLLIQDDGRGITAEELVNARSLGLLGMRERAEMFDGLFHIAAAAPRGTLITVRIPLRSPHSPTERNRHGKNFDS